MTLIRGTPQFSPHMEVPPGSQDHILSKAITNKTECLTPLVGFGLFKPGGGHFHGKVIGMLVVFFRV